MKNTVTGLVPYGDTNQGFHLPDSYSVDWILPPEFPGVSDPVKEVLRALAEPLGGIDLADFRGADSAAIAINDKTRPVPHHQLLPPLLEKIASLGIPSNRTHLIIATGTHTPMPPEEFERVLPAEIIARCKVSSHDCDAPDLVDLGITSRGTPVRMNRQYLESGLRVVVGNIEPHHFMGFSGGVKSASIGLAGRETINRNHALLSDPNARTAVYAENPMRQEVEEIGRMAGIHYALNALLNTNKEIVRVLAGEPIAVMQTAIPLVRSICQVTTSGEYDLVIAAPGGHPKDINFYQSQKGLTHAAMLARDGGTVILAAACPEGVGSTAYQSFLQGINSQEQALEEFNRQGFRVGPHKAFQVARIARRVRVLICSEMPPDQVRRLLLEPASSIQGALKSVLPDLPQPGTRVAVLPRAVATVPAILPVENRL